ncbi:unnamed protein product [Ranitomeya imitator]|uniref:Uncharacterized protein n=1 Tax=Ranitomeya imitator TaxID=111125 RepID=A0ABN9LI00_9NEOB|nr:unnamed protein product [Ranitomeya imitator]
MAAPTEKPLNSGERALFLQLRSAFGTCACEKHYATNGNISKMWGRNSAVTTPIRPNQPIDRRKRPLLLHPHTLPHEAPSPHITTRGSFPTHYHTRLRPHSLPHEAPSPTLPHEAPSPHITTRGSVPTHYHMRLRPPHYHTRLRPRTLPHEARSPHITTRGSVPPHYHTRLPGKHLHSMMLPPPCFTVGIVLGSKLYAGFHMSCTEERRLSGHSAIKARMVEGCSHS